MWFQVGCNNNCTDLPNFFLLLKPVVEKGGRVLVVVLACVVGKRGVDGDPSDEVAEQVSFVEEHYGGGVIEHTAVGDSVEQL